MKAKSQIDTHEAVCAERYKQIQATSEATLEKLQGIRAHFDERLKIRDRLQIITIFAVLFGPGAAADFVKKLIGL